MFKTKRLPRKSTEKSTSGFRLIRLLLCGLGLLVLLIGLLAEGLWFQELDYFQVFATQLSFQVGLGLFAFGVSWSVLRINLAIARKQAWPEQLPETDRTSRTGSIRLFWLLPLVLLLSLLVGIILIYHGQIAVSYWQPNPSLHNNNQASLPLKFHLRELWQFVQNGKIQLWQPVSILGLAVTLLLQTRFLLRAIALLMSLSFGIVLSEHWAQIRLSFSPIPFHQFDPLFGKDLSFYIFTLPAWELLEFWFVGLSTLTLVSVCLVYLLSGNSLSQGSFPGFSLLQQHHLYRLGGIQMLVVALECWFDRYGLLYSASGVVYGAGYTSVHIKLPAYTFLSFLALGIALFLLWRSLSYQGQKAGRQKENRQKGTGRKQKTVSLQPLVYAIGLYILTVILIGLLLPLAVQRLVVQPNELQLEQPYLKQAIALTREAFDLNQIEVQRFDPNENLTYADLQKNRRTIESIRLWDHRPLLETNRQLQRIRLYYEFHDVDIDRYTLPTENGGTTQQQVLVAARELDYSAVPKTAQTWVNHHLIYTHGYGFTVSPVNVAGVGGLPNYFVRGIEPLIVDPRVRGSIPVGKPRIYYGELTNTYVMTQTQAKELDYPSGNDNVYGVYDGWGGVNIGVFWRRLVFAIHLRDWRMLLTRDFTPQTKLLFRRNIVDRIKTIAPFLRFDSDPYLAIVDTGGKAWEHRKAAHSQPSTLQAPDESYLYWIIDAYTTSDRYPYSDPGTADFNYIRNSVKVVVDAYHGAVSFYVADAQDPILQSWQRIFPGMFQPLSQMPEALRRHIRYPQDFYQVQSEQLMTYHMTDPVVFYNREDQWRAPNEVYGDQLLGVEPYYLIMKLPSGKAEEFVLLRPFTPSQRNNLIAWLAARSDGKQYGKMLLYNFPKEKLVYGTEQIEARINQDPVISQRISLWNRQGSRAVQGNLLVIPIDQSLLYVEPLYLEATLNRLPTLVRVIVSYGDRIVMAETLEKALAAVFQPASAETSDTFPISNAFPIIEKGIAPE